MPKKVFLRLPLFSTRATATFSVALVLVILGLAAMVGVATHRLSETIRENMGFVVVLEEGTDASQVAQVTSALKATNGVRKVTYSSSEQILDRWQHMVGNDEDILNLAGVNPFSPELEVLLQPAYSSPDSVALIADPLEMLPQVSSIRVNTDIIGSVNHTLSSVSFTLLIIAAALLIVSFVLIFNTVRLTVYSRRFLINTMQLVGATRGFIRRPFLLENMLNGLIAGLLASGILALLILGARDFDQSIETVTSWEDAALVMVGMVITGVLICLIAAFFACNRYLSSTYDELYK